MEWRIRPYDRARDRDAMWECKRGFELGLGTGTGGDEKARQYEDKLDDAYRDGYLEWVHRCQADDPRTVTVAEAVVDGSETLVGYVFVLPERLTYVWDAAVLNEIFVEPTHRGTGLADDLLVAALEVASEQDLPLERLVLDVDRENDRAQAFYRRHGFEHWGEMVARPLE